MVVWFGMMAWHYLVYHTLPMTVINQLDGLTDRKTSAHSSPNFDTNHFWNALAAKTGILDSDLDS